MSSSDESMLDTTSGDPADRSADMSKPTNGEDEDDMEDGILPIEAPAEDDDDDEPEETVDEPPSFAAALGLHRVGTILPTKPQPQQPIQVLNARGMPARIRKKNKLFFDDNIVNERPPRVSPTKRSMKPNGTTPNHSVSVAPPPSTASPPTKSPAKGLKKRKGVLSRYMKIKEESKRRQSEEAAQKAADAAKSTTTSAAVVEAIDRKIFQRIGLRLRNLLKLPKAHKWVSYEWFYSYIDRPLFEGENDFQICLRESFPQLKTRKLTRCEWSKIRALMGKPRRCSPAFFREERVELERRRQKIRLLQSRKHADASFVKDLPAEIPLALPVGTKVTARLRCPQDGIYTGCVEVVDSMTSAYRITFDRPGLGTHHVPDIEVLANDFTETLSLISLVQDPRPHPNGGSLIAHNRRAGFAAANGSLLSSTNKNDPLLGSEIFNNSKLKALTLPNNTLGGFPLKLLELIIRTKKSLVAKQMKLLRLKNMNAEAEMCRSFDEPLPDDYQRRYASIVIGMEKLNRDMQEYLSQIQNHTGGLSREQPLVAALLAPSYLRERCKELAVQTVQKNNHQVRNASLMATITDMATVMWVASNVEAGSQQVGQVSQTLEVCLEECRNRLDADNAEVFQRNVHVHMRHIERDLRLGGDSLLRPLDSRE